MKLDDYLSMFPELKILYELVKKNFSTKGLVHHNWHHILRNLAIAIKVGEAEKANMKIVLASALLHDIGRLYPQIEKNHCAAGAIVASKYLESAEFAAEEVKAIAHCVRAHGPRGLEEPKTLEAKVIYDVEVLSCSIGYVGVARVFDYFMREEGANVKEMMSVPSGRKGPRRGFYTKTGRILGEKGLKKARDFWEELRQELKAEERVVRDVIPEYEGD